MQRRRKAGLHDGNAGRGRLMAALCAHALIAGSAGSLAIGASERRGPRRTRCRRRVRAGARQGPRAWFIGRQGSSRARKRCAILRPNGTERARYCLQRLLSYFDRGIGALKFRSVRGLLIMQESGSIDFAAENFKLIELTHRQVCQKEYI